MYMLLFSHSVVSDSLWPHELQHIMLPCPSLPPGVCSNSCPLSQWCHPTILSSVAPSPQALDLSQHQGLFQSSQLFTSGGQNIGALASTSVLPVNIQGWFPLQLTGLISLLPKGLSRVFSSTTVQKHQFFRAQPFLWLPRCHRRKVCSEDLGLTQTGLVFVPGSWEKTFKPLKFPKWWECLCYSWWAP